MPWPSGSRKRTGPEIVVVSPKECHGWLEQNTMGAFRDSVFRRMIVADKHERLRLVYPAASRAQDVPIFIHSKVMVVDDELVRIGSANFSRRSMGVDTECDVAVDARGDTRVQAGIRQIRDRLLRNISGCRRCRRAASRARGRSARSLMRGSADHTLVRWRSVEGTPTSEALRAAADPDEPIRSGRTDSGSQALLGRRSRRTSQSFPRRSLRDRADRGAHAFDFSRPEQTVVRISFVTIPVLLVPPSLVAASCCPAGVARDRRCVLFGGLVALLALTGHSRALGYAIGRAIGPAGLPRWLSRRAYRSTRQLGAQGVAGVLDAAPGVSGERRRHPSALRCRARSVFHVHAGTLVGLVPAMFALGGVGALVRRTMLEPSMSNALIAVGAALLLMARRRGTSHGAPDSSVRAIGHQPSNACGVRLVAQSSPSLRVATYNVHECVGTDGRHDPDRIARVVIELDADIVALQEFTYPASVALETRSPVVFTALDRYECALGPTRQTRKQECFGNALFTRHPIVDVHRIDLSMERREPRGALAATIEIGGTLVHVLAAHLGLRLRERRFQVRQILEYLDSVRNTLFVVLGDFNDWLPGRSVVHVLDSRLGKQPRPASFPAYLAGRAVGSDLGSPDTRATTRLHPRDANRATRVGSPARRRGHRRNVSSQLGKFVELPRAVAEFLDGDAHLIE